MDTVESKKSQALGHEGRVAADHLKRGSLNKASLFSLLERYYGAYDSMGEVMLPAPGGGKTKPGCAKGCAFCCHTIVILTAPEAFYVAEHIERTRTPEEFARTVGQVRAADALTRGRKGSERWGGGPPCPLLDLESGACSVYHGRPIACRGLLSSSRASCEAAFTDRKSKPIFDSPFLFQNADVYIYALAIGLKAVGRVIHRLEMNAALATIWSAESPLERWLAGEDIFADARAPNAEQPLV